MSEIKAMNVNVKYLRMSVPLNQVTYPLVELSHCQGMHLYAEDIN